MVGTSRHRQVWLHPIARKPGALWGPRCLCHRMINILLRSRGRLRSRTRKGWGTQAFDDGVHVGIGHALGGADHAFSQLVKKDLAVAVDFHDAGEDEALDLRAERADVSGELKREHGHGAVRKIDGISAAAE